MRRYRAGSGGSTRGHGGVAVPDPFAMVRAYDSESNPARPVRPSPLAASTIKGLPKKVDRATMAAVIKRVASVSPGLSSLPIPKGVDPTKMRSPRPR